MNLIPKKPFTWILLGFVIYAYASYKNPYKKIFPTSNNEIAKYEQQANKQDFSGDTISVTPEKEEPDLSDKAVNYLVKELSKTDTGQAFVQAMVEKSLKKKFGDKDVSLVKASNDNRIIILDKLVGEGDRAVCGSTVKVDYTITSKYKMKLDSSKDTNKPITLTIGDGTAIKGLENGIVGMKKGGIRKLAIPPHLAYLDPKFKNDLVSENNSILVEVELLDLKNGNSSDAEVTISDVSQGYGLKTVVCDNNIDISYKTKSGEVGNLNFIVSDKTIPYGLEQGVLGMKLGQVRNLVIPSELLNINEKSKLGNIKIEKGRDLEIEVTLQSIKD